MVKIALKLFICPFCPYTRGRACSTDPLGGKWHKAESLKGFLPHSAALQHALGLLSLCQAALSRGHGWERHAQLSWV